MTQQSPITWRAKRKLKKIIAVIREHFPTVQAIYLFGTWGTKYQGKYSDIDIGFVLSPEEAIDTSQKRTREPGATISRIAQADHCDLINMRLASPVLQREILYTGQLVYASSTDESLAFEAMVSTKFYHFLKIQELTEKNGDGTHNMTWNSAKSLADNVNENLSKIKETISEIDQLQAETNSQISWQQEDLIAFNFSQMVDAVKKIAQDLCRQKGWKRKKMNAYDTFNTLHKNGIISQEILSTMEELIDPRNYIIHNYESIEFSHILELSREKIHIAKDFVDIALKSYPKN